MAAESRPLSSRPRHSSQAYLAGIGDRNGAKILDAERDQAVSSTRAPRQRSIRFLRTDDRKRRKNADPQMSPIRGGSARRHCAEIAPRSYSVCVLPDPTGDRVQSADLGFQIVDQAHRGIPRRALGGALVGAPLRDQELELRVHALQVGAKHRSSNAIGLGEDKGPIVIGNIPRLQSLRSPSDGRSPARPLPSTHTSPPMSPALSPASDVVRQAASDPVVGGGLGSAAQVGRDHRLRAHRLRAHRPPIVLRWRTNRAKRVSAARDGASRRAL